MWSRFPNHSHYLRLEVHVVQKIWRLSELYSRWPRIVCSAAKAKYPAFAQRDARMHHVRTGLVTFNRNAAHEKIQLDLEQGG